MTIQLKQQEFKKITCEITMLRNEVIRANREIEKLITEDTPLLKSKLKGDQLTAFIGEYYANKLIDGVDIEPNEKHSYDLIGDGKRIEVKTRIFNKDSSSSWKQTSTISEKESNDVGPTNLCFVLLNQDYSIHGVWLFDWQYLLESSRLKPKKVRGIERAYYFMLRYKQDEEYRIF